MSRGAMMRAGCWMMARSFIWVTRGIGSVRNITSFDWLMMSSLGMDVTIEEETHDVAALAVQGPTSCSVLKRSRNIRSARS